MDTFKLSNILFDGDQSGAPVVISPKGQSAGAGGSRSSDLPVVQSTKLRLVINLKGAKALSE